MSQSQDEARTARIQKYKEERRKQLTAKTATLFSANVTDRRTRRAGRLSSDETADHLKSSSELNLASASSVPKPIRTTRASRLRAAAASHTDSSSTSRKSNRSSSAQPLLDTKATKSSRLIERDKRTNKRQNIEKENAKSATTNDIGAKTKSKHSIKIFLEKDKCNISVTSLKSNDEKPSSKLDEKNSNDENVTENCIHIHVNGVEAFDDIVGNDSLEKDRIDDLFDDLVGGQSGVKLNLDSNTGLNGSHSYIVGDKDVMIEDSVVPKVEDDRGMLGAVCVRRVERFSELLSNLCSPCEADVLFEDILVENGIEGQSDMRAVPECTPPCRRAQPSPRPTSTSKRAPAPVVNDAAGAVQKTKTRRPLETSHLKTESPLPSSRTSPKSTINLSFGIKTSHLKTSPSTSTPQKLYERRRVIDNSKPSCIPLVRKSTDKNIRNSTSPVKQGLTPPKPEHKLKLESPRSKAVLKSPEKAKSDTESNRIDRRNQAQKDSESLSEKYHYSKKRLTSLEKKSPRDTNGTSDVSPKRLVNGGSKAESKSEANTSGVENSKVTMKMSTLHEVRPHTSRLSQEMDSLTALTKQTLDRVNKLSSNLTSNKLNIETPAPRYESIFASKLEQRNNNGMNHGLINDGPFQPRGVTERLRDIDTAAQRLIDFEKQSAMFSDLNGDTSSQNRRLEGLSMSCSHTPVSILKRKSIHEDNVNASTSNQTIASPPVTFSPSVIEPRNCRTDSRQRQGILKKRRSLDESQVARRRSCSPEVSFADDDSPDTNKPILKNRRSSLEDIIRNRSPDGQIQGILKRKMSREEDLYTEEISNGSPEPHGILKRKSNSSSSSSTTSSHVSIAQAVLLAAAGGAEIVDEDKETVRPILKKKSFSEERPSPDIIPYETPKPILKKKSIEHDEYEHDLPRRPILKSSKKLSGDEGHASSFELSEDDRSSRRPSLLRSRTSDHSGSECENAMRPILKQRGSSLTRERSQSPRPRLSFCADNDANISVANFSSDAIDLLAAGPRRLNLAPEPATDPESSYPSAVLRRRNQRPKSNQRSKSLACDVNDELLSILNNRRLKVDENCKNGHNQLSRSQDEPENDPKSFPSIASRIKSMEQALSSRDQPSTSTSRRDNERYKTQPITVEEMRLITSSLEPGQASFRAFGQAGCSFPSRVVESGVAPVARVAFPLPVEPERDPYGEFASTLDTPPNGASSFSLKSPTSVSCLLDGAGAKDDSYGEATFLDFENIVASKQSTLDDIELEVNKVRVALDEDSRALEDDDRQQAEADNWSLNVSCDSGVYNRASSRDSGPQSGEELGLIDNHEINENHASNSSSNEWSSPTIERNLINMERARKSTENDRSPEPSDDEENRSSFALGLAKSSSVVARASMWQALQQKAKGTPKPLLRHSRSKTKDCPVTERFKTQPISFTPPEPEVVEPPPNSLAQSKSTANVLDRDEDAKLDEDDPAKMSLGDKMKMFNAKLTHKPPMAGLPKGREERVLRASRLRTMPVLASQVQEAMEQNERLTKSLTHEDVPRNPDFALKMELFRSASAKNTSLEYLMRQNSKFRSLDLEDDSPSERAQRMITPEVRGILKCGSTVVPKQKTLAKGESSEGLKDEGIDSSSDDETSSTVSSSEKSCSSSDSSEDPDPKPRRFQRKNNKLKASVTESDIPRQQEPFTRAITKIQLPAANEFKERLNQAKNQDVKIPTLGKLGRKPSEDIKIEDDLDQARYRRFGSKNEPIQLGKLRRPQDKVLHATPPVSNISALNQAAKAKFFGVEDKKEKTVDELAASVRKFIAPMSKSISSHVMEVQGSGSDGESSGGREVRHINTRVRHRLGGGIQRSATHADMPHRGSTIAERLAALQAAGANDWRARVCRLSPEKEDSKAIERAKNRINESLNTEVEDKKKAHIDDELGANILADRRNKLETAAQGWRKRVPQTDASLFTVAGRLERDKVAPTPPSTPSTPPAVSAPLVASPVIASPGIPVPNKFRSRKQATSPTNGFVSGPLRSASCAVVSQVAAAAEAKPRELPRIDREAFKRSHSVSETINRADEKDETSPGAEKSGCAVRVPRADDETFHAFFAPLQQQDRSEGLDVDLDAIDSAQRQLLTNEWTRRAKRERKHVASRNPLKALAARTDIREEYVAQHSTGLREQLIKEKATANCGLAAEALAALASKEDFASVALRSAAASQPAPAKPLMLLQVKGRRRVQTRLVEPVHSSVNRGDCFILVTPDHVYLYMGHYANVIERNRSTDVALHIHNTKDLGCKSSSAVTKIDEHSKTYTNKQWNQFWSLLGVNEDVDNYKPIETGHADEDEIFESCMVQTNMCYEVTDEELVPIKEYWGQQPRIAMLNQTKSIVFDFGSEMYIWYGKNVPLESRRRAAQLAKELFDEGYNYEECHINPLNAATHQGARDQTDSPSKVSKSRPEWAILSKITQHMETILFKEKFLDWPDYTRVIQVKPQENKSNSIEITPCDADEMWSNEYIDPDLILDGAHIGRGTHYYDKENMRHYDVRTKSVCKWVIREYDYIQIDNDVEIGEFFSGDSYIIRWEYQITATGRELNGKPSKHNVTGRDRCAYFCWQGKDASSNEKGAAALLTVELDREKGPQIRVAQGNEPPAFLNLFQGNLVVHQGKKDVEKSRYKLFVTRGSLPNEAYLLQVPCSVRQLRSRGSLLLVDTDKGCMYIWHGARSLKHTKNIAVELANKLIARKPNNLFENVNNIKITEVKESEEPKEVLEALGVANKQHYNSVLNGGKDCGDVTPRLFHFTDLGGQFEANEILSPLRNEQLVTPFPFEQKELYTASQPALFLLDDGVSVWLWQGWWPRGEDGELEPAERNAGVGAFAGRWQAMRAAALRTAEAYWRVSRASPAAVGVVAAGLEPRAFTDLFDTWADHDHAAEANIAHGYKAGEVLSGACELSRLCCQDAVLPLAALQRRPLPDHVDPHHLERHLSAPDFQEAFGMTKEDFSVLPAWKQTNMKKDVGLF